MKRVAYLMAIVIVHTIMACKKEEDKNAFGKKVMLYLNQSTQIGNESNLNFKLKKVSDSRCRQDMICIWEGYASADIQITNAGTVITSLEICTGGCTAVNKQTQQTFTVNNKSYSVLLNDVNNEDPARVYAVVTVTPK